MTRGRTPGAVSLGGLVIVALLVASPARALVIEAGSVKLASRSDDVRVKGRYDGVTIDGAAAVVVTIDRVSLRVPLASFARKRSILTHRGPGGPGQISRLRIDLRKRRFLFTATGWALAGLSNPFRFAIGTDAATDCSMARLRGRAGRRRKRPTIRLAVVRADACGGLGIPRVRPVTVPVGVSTEVRVRVDVPAGAGLDTASVRLFRTDGAGSPAGDALCTMSPDPAAPGAFGCSTTVAEAAASLVPLVVTGRAAGADVSSPGVTLPVVAPPTDQDLTAVGAAAEEAEALWEQSRDRLGDTLAARMETLRALGGVPGIMDAALSPDGIDIVMRYTTGWLGGLVLNRPAEDGGAAQSVPRPEKATPSAHLAGSGTPLSVFRSCPAEGSGVCCTSSTARAPLLGRRVLIWYPGFFKVEDGPIAQQKFAAGACLGFGKPHIVTGAAADVASVLDFPNYETVVISSHGIVDGYDRVVLVTAEGGTLESLRSEEKRLADGDVEVEVLPVSKTQGLLGVSEDFIAAIPGRFPPNAIVYASHCYSAYKNGALPYGTLGVGVHFGYDWTTHQDYTSSVVGQLFEHLVKRYETTGDAYDAVSPKVDPHALFGHVPDPTSFRTLAELAQANFVPTGLRIIAYVGAASVTPQTSDLAPGEQAVLRADAQGRGSCELTFHWKNTAEHGHLTGDGPPDDFEGMQDEATYTANDSSNDEGIDDVGVELTPPDGGNPIGVACADVDTKGGCGDGVRQDPEQCDGTDDAACPGECTASCLCGTRCGDNHVDPGEICDGTDADVCPGKCKSDCTCAICGNSTTDAPFEECDRSDDAACPGRCTADCRCGCTPGDPSSCPGQCCDPLDHLCGYPARTASDPPVGSPGAYYTASGCCGNAQLPPDFCGGPGGLAVCPTTCEEKPQRSYECLYCDGKLLEWICGADSCTDCSGPSCK